MATHRISEDDKQFETITARLERLRHYCIRCVVGTRDAHAQISSSGAMSESRFESDGKRLSAAGLEESKKPKMVSPKVAEIRAARDKRDSVKRPSAKVQAVRAARHALVGTSGLEDEHWQ